MLRVIVDFKKLTPEILKMVVDKYPDGYGDDDIIKFRNAKGELVEAVEVKTEDTMYLVKVSNHLETHMESFDEDDYDDAQMSDPDAIPVPEVKPEDEDLEDESDDD